MPRSRARRIAASDSSSEVCPHPSGVPDASVAPPMAQAPKPMALTLIPVRPSSRYCIDEILQADLLDLFHFLEGTEKVERGAVQRRIDGDDGHRLAAAVGPGEVVLGDVDLPIAEQGADLAHHSGDVLVDDVSQGAGRFELHAEVVYRHDPLVRLTEKRGGETDLLAVGHRAERDQVVVVA